MNLSCFRSFVNGVVICPLIQTAAEEPEPRDPKNTSRSCWCPRSVKSWFHRTVWPKILIFKCTEPLKLFTTLFLSKTHKEAHTHLFIYLYFLAQSKMYTTPRLRRHMVEDKPFEKKWLLGVPRERGAEVPERVYCPRSKVRVAQGCYLEHEKGREASRARSAVSDGEERQGP